MLCLLRSLIYVVSRDLSIVCCMLDVAGYMLYVVCLLCMDCNVSRGLYVACCMLYVAGIMLHVLCCMVYVI